MQVSTIYSELGDEKLLQLVNVFYDKIEKDNLLRSMFPSNLEYARLFQYMFLKQVFGGPRDYEEFRGHPMMRIRHLLFKIGIKERDRWLTLMQEAMKDVNIIEPQIVNVMHMYFNRLATKIVNSREQALEIASEKNE